VARANCHAPENEAHEFELVLSPVRFFRGELLSRISAIEGQATALEKPGHNDPGRIAEGLVPDD
jgi:hypothetical protein